MTTDKFDKWLKTEQHMPGKPSNIKPKPIPYDKTTKFEAQTPIDALHELLDMLIAQMDLVEERSATGIFDMVLNDKMEDGFRMTLNLSSQKLTKEELENFKQNKGDN